MRKEEKKNGQDNGQDRSVYSGLMAGENQRGKPHLDFTGDRRIRTTLTKCQPASRSGRLLGLLPEFLKEQDLYPEIPEIPCDQIREMISERKKSRAESVVGDFR